MGRPRRRVTLLYSVAPAPSVRGTTGATARALFVIVSAVIALAIFLPTIGLAWNDRGETGFELNAASGEVRDVRAGSPAWNAGIRPGDRIDAAALTPKDRILLFDVEAVPPDMQLTLRIKSNDRVRTVSFVSARVPVNGTLLYYVVFALQTLTYAVFVITGATLVLLQPSVMTWALYAYCLCTAQIHDGFRYYDALPAPLFVTFYLVGATFLTGFTPFPLLPFAARFPGRRSSVAPTSSLHLWTFVVVLAALHWAALAFASAFVPQTHAVLAPYYRFVHVASAVAAYALAALLLLRTYRAARGVDRPRLQWAVFGMTLSFVVMGLGYIASAAALSFTVVRALNNLAIVMPISIAYAILRHRLLDVRFVLNRAAIYAMMTTVLIVVLETINWLVGLVFADEHWAKLAEGFAAVGVGILSDRIYNGSKGMLERVLFRNRREAEQRLARIGAAFAFADSEKSIGEGLTHEPAEALSLASAAVFRRDEAGQRYVRSASAGWESNCTQQLDFDDVLIRLLQSEEKYVSLSELHWKRDDVPVALAAPALAIPLCVRHKIIAVAMYGGHANGSELDPEEIAVLMRLTDEAARAYDHADAQHTIERLTLRNAQAGVATSS